MSSDKIVVDLEPREQVGKRLSALRSAGMTPAVIHNHGKDSIHVQGNIQELARVYNQAGKHHPVELKVASKQYLALIKDVDFEPTKHRMRHVVFQAIKQNEAVEAEIPVVFTPEAEVPAERKGLLVLKQLDHVQVKALPKDLPDELVIDPSSLEEVGDSLSVADIVVPTNVTLLTETETQVAVVEMPKDQIAEADAAAAALAEDADKPADEGEESTDEAPASETAESQSESD